MKGAVDRSIKQTKRFHKVVERERKSVDNSQTESARFTMEDRRRGNDRGTNTSVIVILNRTTPTKSVQTVHEFYTDPISHQIIINSSSLLPHAQVYSSSTHKGQFTVVDELTHPHILEGDGGN